jgi:hypothetical protein
MINSNAIDQLPQEKFTKPGCDDAPVTADRKKDSKMRMPTRHFAESMPDERNKSAVSSFVCQTLSKSRDELLERSLFIDSFSTDR